MHLSQKLHIPCAYKSKLAHTLCTFRPKFAHTLCANKAYHFLHILKNNLHSKLFCKMWFTFASDVFWVVVAECEEIHLWFGTFSPLTTDGSRQMWEAFRAAGSCLEDSLRPLQPEASMMPPCNLKLSHHRLHWLTVTDLSSPLGLPPMTHLTSPPSEYFLSCPVFLHTYTTQLQYPPPIQGSLLSQHTTGAAHSNLYCCLLSYSSTLHTHRDRCSQTFANVYKYFHVYI